MKFILWLGLSLGCAGSVSAQGLAGYEEVFRDNFTYGTDENGHIDFKGQWYYRPPEGLRFLDGDGFNTADAAEIIEDGDAQDGKALVLKCFTDPLKPELEKNRCATISTFNDQDADRPNSRWLYGYFEARMKFEDDASGCWSSFWIYDFDWDSDKQDYKRQYLGQTEIDIHEHFTHGEDGPKSQREIFSNLHFGQNSQLGFEDQNECAVSTKIPGFDSREYHTYGLLWTETGYKVFLDGQFLHELPTEITLKREGKTYELDTHFKTPHYLLLSNELRPGFSGARLDDYGTRDNPRARVVIDYVTVWQKKE